MTTIFICYELSPRRLLSTRLSLMARRIVNTISIRPSSIIGLPSATSHAFSSTTATTVFHGKRQTQNRGTNNQDLKYDFKDNDNNTDNGHDRCQNIDDSKYRKRETCNRAKNLYILSQRYKDSKT